MSGQHGRFQGSCDWLALPWDGNPVRPGPGEVPRWQGSKGMSSLPYLEEGVGGWGMELQDPQAQK